MTRTMPTTLSYGQEAICTLEDAEAIVLRPNESQPLEASQIAERVKSQLIDPINYPGLAHATIPGDEIVIAVESCIPQVTCVLDGALQAFASAGSSPQQISILMAGSQSRVEAVESALAELGHSGYKFELHDPDNEKEVAFLGVSETGTALRLNRRLCDADFVLPIGATTCHLSEDEDPTNFLGPFPSFSDRETIERLANLEADHFPAAGEDGLGEIQDCARQLGAQFNLQIVPHANEQIAEIVAGESTAVLRAVEAAYRSVWESEAPARGSLVIATITGGMEQQTWRSLGRAIAVADRLLEPEGSLVICSEINEPPGKAVGQLAGDDDALVIEREIEKTHSADCGTAMVLSRALQRGSVYLRSQLRSSVVESLGITPLESDNELERLTQMLRPCVVLEDAQFLLPRVAKSESHE